MALSQITTEEFFTLIQKIRDGKATTEERLLALREMNRAVEEFNKMIKELTQAVHSSA